MNSNMFKDISEKKNLIFFRLNNMEVMKHCLLRYKETQDERFWEYAEIFGNWSKKWKKELESLST